MLSPIQYVLTQRYWCAGLGRQQQGEEGAGLSPLGAALAGVSTRVTRAKRPQFHQGALRMVTTERHFLALLGTSTPVLHLDSSKSPLGLWRIIRLSCSPQFPFMGKF